jgi:apolipoprotein N-acyltransferase
MRPFLKDVVWLLVSFALWAAAFHPLDLWLLAWVAMVPAFVRLGTPMPEGSGRRRLGLAWVVAQFFLHAALMAWAGVIAVPLVFLTPLLGIPFSWLTGFLLDRGFVRLRLPLLFAAPLAVVLVEVVRDQALRGLTWASIGYSQWRWLDLVQLASLGRVHAVSLVVLLANAAIATSILRWRRRASAGPRLRPLLIGAVVVALGAGAGALIRPRVFDEGPLTLGLQPNIPQVQRQRGRGSETLQAHHDLLRTHLARHPGVVPDLLVYSETSFGRTREPEVTIETLLDRTVLGAGPDGPRETMRVRDLVLPGRHQVTILGLVRGLRLPESGRGGPRDDDDDGFDETNVAWVLRGGVPTGVCYAKRELAPFGEFTPLPHGVGAREAVKKAIRASVGYVPGLNPGTEPAVFEVGSPGGPRRGGLSICFEMAFPRCFRESVRLGADFHVNISNDAWFDGSSELDLVDVAGIFRAVESGRALFRVSNSGISTLVGPDGARLAVVEDAEGRRTQVRGSLLGRIPIGRGETPYVRLGDLPWILPAVLLISALVLATIRAKRLLLADSPR